MSQMQPSRQSQQEIDFALRNIPAMKYGRDFTVRQLGFKFEGRILKRPGRRKKQ